MAKTRLETWLCGMTQRTQLTLPCQPKQTNSLDCSLFLLFAQRYYNFLTLKSYTERVYFYDLHCSNPPLSSGSDLEDSWEEVGSKKSNLGAEGIDNK